MEQEYVIGVTNKFAAFIDESEDPYDIIKNVEAEKLKKKSLKVSVSNENKENKAKDGADPKGKPAPRKPAAKPAGDRVQTAERAVKPDTAPDARPNNRRNRDDWAPATGNNEFPRTGNFREGNKPEGGAPRGPRTDAPKGERREGGPRPPRAEGEGRPFRGDGEGGRPFRGPRPEGEARPFRQDRDRQQGSDGEGRPPRRERREFNTEGPDLEGRPDRRPAGGPRGRGTRPPGPGRNYDTRGKREFDRKSGSDRTGVKSVDKRDGAGTFNWDSTKDVEAMTTDLNVTNLSDEADWDESGKEGEPAPTIAKEAEEPAEEAPAAPVEEEPQELTLDEYRALRGKREKPQYDIRKPGEGEDLTQWKNMVEIKKKEDEQDVEEELEIAEFPQRAGRQRHVVGIDITFNDSFRGGRGRGRGAGPGAGRGRGGREGRDMREPKEPREPREPRESRGDRGDRGGDRGDRGGERSEGRDRDRGDAPPRRFPREDRFPREERKDDRGSRQSAPKVDDEKAFPSLG